MPDFAHAEAPHAQPTHCVFCPTHKDKRGFAHRDTVIPAYGHVYICAQCVIDAGKVFGLVAPDKHAKTAGELAEARAEIDRLVVALDDEKLNKVIPLADVVDFFDAYEEKHGHKPGEKPAPKAAA